MNKLAVAMTCHNRRVRTLACLEALFRSDQPDALMMDIFLTDDGSQDGTAAAVLGQFPQIKILTGNGKLFWNGGMRLAFGTALALGYDYYLWLNDDTILDSDALIRLFATQYELGVMGLRNAIVVGTTRDTEGRPSYGGLVRGSRWRPLRFKRVIPNQESQLCLTMNGNCVLLASLAAQALGNLDARYIHTLGDNDYGLRAQRIGIPLYVMSGYAGTCVNDNSMEGSFNDRTLSLSVRWKKIISPKGLPPIAWLTFCRRHVGMMWPLIWLWPYLKVILTSVAHGSKIPRDAMTRGQITPRESGK